MQTGLHFVTSQVSPAEFSPLKLKHFYTLFMFCTKACRWSTIYILLTLHPVKNLPMADLSLTCELVHGALAVSSAVPWSGHIAASAPWWSCGRRGHHTACRRQALCEPHQCWSACLCRIPQWSPPMVQKGRSGETCAEKIILQFFLTHFFLCFPQFNGSFFCSIPFLQKFKTSAETVALKMEMQALQLRKIIRLISTTLQFQCQVEQNNLPVSSKLLRGWKRR